MNFDVGQIIYVLSGETDKIIPMQVCEELRRRSIEGEDVTYLVRSGPNKSETFKIDQINGKVFTSLELARAHLKAKFDKWIEEQVEWTVATQRSWYKMEPSEGPK